MKPVAPSRLVLSLSEQFHFDTTTILGFLSSIAVGNEWGYDFDIDNGHAISTTGIGSGNGTGTAKAGTVSGNIPGVTTRYWHTTWQCWALLSTFSSALLPQCSVLVKIQNTPFFFAD